MNNDAREPVSARKIAAFLQMELIGSDLPVFAPYSPNNCQPGGVIFCELNTPEMLAVLSDLPNCLVICSDEMGMCLNGSRIVSPTPRLSFIRIVERFFAPPRINGIHPTVILAGGVILGKNVAIGAYSWIGPSVSIGDNCVLGHHVVVDGYTTIGNGSVIKSNSVIGEEGFAFCMDADGVPHHFPHVGKITIGQNVWIGANSTVERAMLEDTVIEDHVKIDDHVQIGHNTRIGKGTRIAAGVIICGRTRVEEECWIAPNVTIIEKRVIGRKSLLGLAATVITDVPPNSVFVGNPAKKLRDNEI